MVFIVVADNLATQVAKNYQLNKSKYLLASELTEMNRILSLFKSTDTRNVTLLKLALKTGSRASELLNVKWSDIDHEDHTVFIEGIKGSNDREIPVEKSLYQDLLSLRPSNFSKTDKVFKISYQRLIQIWNFYRPIEKKFHSLRHTFALELYKKTRDLRLVQVALGHRNIQNTIIYAEYVYSTEELKKLIL